MIQMQKKLSSLEEGKEEFFLECRIKNLTKRTIKYYQDCFGYFEKFLKEHYGENNLLEQLTKENVNKYIIYLKDREIKDTTINIRLREIRGICYYFMRNGYIQEFKISMIKEDQKIPSLYTDEEIAILLKKPNLKTCDFTEFRTWTMINFFVATGVRSRTLRNVQIQDLDFENDLIYLTTTKNRKDAVIPLGMNLKKILIEYLKYRKGEKEDYLFCDVEGEQIKRSALNKIIERYNNQRGVEKTGIHKFRHYFAKNYIQNGGDALKLQKILGHSTLKQTQQYVDLFGKDLQKDFDDLNPLNKFYKNTERIKMRVS